MSTEQPQRYVAVLRCQTFHVWPESTVIEARRFSLELEPGRWIRAQLAVLSYQNREDPAEYLDEETRAGPLIPLGRAKGLYTVRNSILKAPEDKIPVEWKYVNARRGEIDISVAFPYPHDLTAPMHETLQRTMLAIMGLLNLHLDEHITPSAPLHVRKMLSSGEWQSASSLFVSVFNRSTLQSGALQHTVSGIAEVLSRSENSQRLKTALELYGSHLTEVHPRTRFLLLVIAMEALASPRNKHPVVTALADKWRAELKEAQKECREGSEEHFALAAFERELLVRKEISIRSQVRELFAQVELTLGLGLGVLSRRALRVYDQRSKLVHDGLLPEDELEEAENEARELLELALKSQLP